MQPARYGPPCPNALRVYDSGHVLAWANALATDDDSGLVDLGHAVLD